MTGVSHFKSVMESKHIYFYFSLSLFFFSGQDNGPVVFLCMSLSGASTKLPVSKPSLTSQLTPSSPRWKVPVWLWLVAMSSRSLLPRLLPGPLSLISTTAVLLISVWWSCLFLLWSPGARAAVEHLVVVGFFLLEKGSWVPMLSGQLRALTHALALKKVTEMHSFLALWTMR